MTTNRTITYPMKVAANHRHIVDATETPILFQGDAAWSIIANLTLDEATDYLDDRVAKGFNSLLVNLLEYKFADDAPRNRAGDEPFVTPGDFRVPNEAYMRHAQDVLDLCRERDLIVFLSPAYLGYPHESVADRADGWYVEVLTNGLDNCREWGRYLGQRFGSYTNLIWQIGGDRNPGDATPHLGAIAQGLRDSGVHNLFCAHVLPENSALDLPGMSWVDINLTYTYEIVHWKVLTDWKRDPACPTILIESTYEGERDASALQIRRQAWWSVLCGANGHVMGNLPIWPFRPGWREALDLPGSVAMEHFGSFFRAIRWYDLVPDVDHAVVRGDLGEERGLDRTCAAVTNDGLLAVAYSPAPRTLTIDTRRFGGCEVDVEWFNPITASRVSGTLIPPNQTVELTTPFTNDAVLTLSARA